MEKNNYIIKQHCFMDGYLYVIVHDGVTNKLFKAIKIAESKNIDKLYERIPD